MPPRLRPQLPHDPRFDAHFDPRIEIDRRRMLALGTLGVGALAAALTDGGHGTRAAAAGTRTPLIPGQRGGPSGTSQDGSWGGPVSVPTGSATSAPTSTPGVPDVDPTQPPAGTVPRGRPVYTVHDLLPNAPANAVALTIDDGPHPVYTPQMLDLLRKLDIQATFSLIGSQVHANLALVRRMVAEGHRVANHTWTHPQPITRLAPARIRAEIEDTQSVLVDAGAPLPTLFRSPGGDWSKEVFALCASYDLIPIDWDVDPRDWSRPGVPHIRKQLLSARPGDILLCHDGGGNRAQTLAALATVLPVLKARGLSFVTL